MKSPAAYYLLILYATIVIKPLLPVMSDIWEHQFNEIEHIGTIHAKYGSHHLQKEIADTENDHSKKQNTVKTDDPVTIHVFTKAYTLHNENTFVNRKFLCPQQLKLPSVHLRIQLPPPKVS